MFWTSVAEGSGPFIFICCVVRVFLFVLGFLGQGVLVAGFMGFFPFYFRQTL